MRHRLQDDREMVVCKSVNFSFWQSGILVYTVESGQKLPLALYD